MTAYPLATEGGFQAQETLDLWTSGEERVICARVHTCMSVCVIGETSGRQRGSKAPIACVAWNCHPSRGFQDGLDQNAP